MDANILTELTTKAVNDGIVLAYELYKGLKEKKFDSLYLPKHDNYPSIAFYDSGLPYFTTTPGYFGHKVSYEKILENSKQDIELDSWKSLVNLYISTPQLYSFLKFNQWGPDYEDQNIDFIDFYIHQQLRKIVDAVFHSTKNPINDKKVKSQKIKNWITSICSKHLNYEIIIPIIIHQPEGKRFTINEKIRIEQLSRKIQLSRNFELPDDTIAHQKVIAAATHGIFISDILTEINNDNRWERISQVIKKIESSVDKITGIFANLRIAISEPIGFCQVIAKPLDWEDDWFGDLEKLDIFGYRKYPPIYEKERGFSKLIITKSQLSIFKTLVNKDPNNKKINIAKHKLFEADTREKEDDSVLDISIALEALLGDSYDNLRYKVSLRCAAICKKIRLLEFTPLEIKNGIKIFYDYRSAIIHEKGPKEIKKPVQFHLRDVSL